MFFPQRKVSGKEAPASSVLPLASEKPGQVSLLRPIGREGSGLELPANRFRRSPQGVLGVVVRGASAAHAYSRLRALCSRLLSFGPALTGAGGLSPAPRTVG